MGESEGTGLPYSPLLTDGGISGEYPNHSGFWLVLMKKWFTFSVEAVTQIREEFKVNWVKDCISK